jgi:signal transduction histidine kinase
MKQDRLPHSNEVPSEKRRECSSTGSASASTVDRELERRRRRWLAWSLFAFGAVWVAVGSVLLVLRVADGTLTPTAAFEQFALLPPAAAFSVVGLVVALRQPRNACGWLMLVIGTIWSLGVSPPLQPDSLLEWATTWGWVPPFGLMATHLPLRLPDGRLPSPRWRWVSRLATVAMVATSFGLLFDPEIPGNPVPNRGLAFIALGGLILLGISAILSIASLVVRSRTAGAEERHQIRWIAIGAAVFLAVWLLSFVAQPVFGASPADDPIVSSLTLLFYCAIPVSIGIAILKYRLYDIDIVIRKTLVVAVLAAFFVLVYALVVGGVGALVETSSNSTLSFAAAAVVAVLFQPVLGRARRFADRFVYGERATPYEVLAEFSEHLAETYAADDVLPRTARVLAEGVGADRARVWLSAGRELRPVATWPNDADPARPDDHRAEVRHQGDLLGALSVAMPASDPMDPAKEKLMADLAAQAGLVLRNVRLVEDLRGSRRRLVSAQDEERRRLERNIHDGAQQQLVALAVKARLARQLTDRDPEKVAQLLSQIEAETSRALEDLRDLARGIYPPLLADKGLAAALEAQARRSAIQVEVIPDGVSRYPQAVEAAVYFSVLEALQNVAKYADASRADVRLAQAGSALTFEVRDDGRGFDPASIGYGTGLQGIADRLAALNGTLRVASAAGDGTTVTGVIPLEEVTG